MDPNAPIRPFIEKTPHRLVRVDQYFNYLNSTIHERLSGLRFTPQHIAMDGWLGAVKVARLAVSSAWRSEEKQKLREDRVMEILLSKEIAPEELDLELIMAPHYELHSAAESLNFDRHIDHYWFELCRAKGQHGPTDHLEFDWNYKPTPDSTACKCRVQLRRPQTFPLHVSYFGMPDDSFARIDQFFTSLRHEQYPQTIPQCSVFFSSRLEYLRNLTRQAEVFKRHNEDHKYESVKKRIFNVVLQLTLYHRSMTAFPAMGVELGDSMKDWEYMIEVASFFGNETFGKFGFEQNRRFLEENKGKFEGILEEAAEWWCPNNMKDRLELAGAIKAMINWLTSGIEALENRKRGQTRRMLSPPPLSLSHLRNPFLPRPRYPL